MEQAKASSTIFIVVVDSFVVSPLEASESSGCRRLSRRNLAFHPRSGLPKRYLEGVLVPTSLLGTSISPVPHCWLLAGVELCSVVTSGVVRLGWRLCSGGELLHSLAFFPRCLPSQRCLSYLCEGCQWRRCHRISLSASMLSLHRNRCGGDASSFSCADDDSVKTRKTTF